MTDLNNKNVLLLAPKAFGYEIEIKNEIKNLGANVILFDERPKNTFITKVFLRLNQKFFIQKEIDRYYSSIIKSTKDNNFDYLVLINPETIDVSKIELIRGLHRDIRVVVYMWDSVKNKKSSLKLLKVSDSFFTFDSNDKKIDKDIKFLPLFYISDYENITSKERYKYDMTFIGTLHSDRYTIIKKIEKLAKQQNLSTFFYFYSPSLLLFWVKRIFDKSLRGVSQGEVSFESLAKKDILRLIGNSRVIVDIEHPSQSGLTMRTIEMIGAKRKLITTNKEIQGYDFYRKENINLLKRDDVSIDLDFISGQYKSIDSSIYSKYSIRSWAEKLFE